MQQLGVALLALPALLLLLAPPRLTDMAIPGPLALVSSLCTTRGDVRHTLPCPADGCASYPGTPDCDSDTLGYSGPDLVAALAASWLRRSTPTQGRRCPSCARMRRAHSLDRILGHWSLSVPMGKPYENRKTESKILNVLRCDAETYVSLTAR